MKTNETDRVFMENLEAEYRLTSGLQDREFYKIYYSPVRKADILLLGINPGGKPDAPDSIIDLNRSITFQENIRRYCEDGRHDLLDHDWHENRGLMKLLLPILGSKEVIQNQVVKTNIAFKRSPSVKKAGFIERAKLEAAPFLNQIISHVQPKLILLAGVQLTDFTRLHAGHVEEIEPREVSKTHQTIFWSARIITKSGTKALAVSTAHASRFSYLYGQFDVPERVRKLLQ